MRITDPGDGGMSGGGGYGGGRRPMMGDWRNTHPTESNVNVNVMGGEGGGGGLYTSGDTFNPGLPSDNSNPTNNNDALAAWYSGQEAHNANVKDWRGMQHSHINQAKTAQELLLQQLQDIASGRVKSPAEQQLEQQYQAAQAMAYSGMSGVRNVGGGELRRSMDTQASGIERQQADDQRVLHAQAQQQAQQALAQFYQLMRQQDLQQAGLNAQAQFGQRNINDQYAQGLLQGGIMNDVAGTQSAQQMGAAQMGVDQGQRDITKGWWNTGTEAAGTAIRGFGGMP